MEHGSSVMPDSLERSTVVIQRQSGTLEHCRYLRKRTNFPFARFGAADVAAVVHFGLRIAILWAAAAWSGLVAAPSPSAPVLHGVSLVGGGAWNEPRALGFDGTGNIYLAGQTNAWDMPTTPGVFDPWGKPPVTNHMVGFAVKLDPTGTRVLWSTYLFGARVARLAVDAEGYACLAGTAWRRGLPATPGAFQPRPPGLDDEYAFVMKLRPDGTSAEYATYLGGRAGPSAATGIAVDASGVAWVCGTTGARDFPVTPGAARTGFGGRDDAFVAALSPRGDRLLASTFLGGLGDDAARAIRLDGEGNVVVAGTTSSYDFPASPFYSPAPGSGGFVLRLTPALDGVLHSAYLPVGNIEALDVGPDGRVHTAGLTRARDFPLSPGWLPPAYTDYSGNPRHFYTVFDAALARIESSALFGGSGFEFQEKDLAVDSGGFAHVAGASWSTDFPFTLNAANRTPAEGAYLARFHPDGRLDYLGSLNRGLVGFAYALAVRGRELLVSGRGATASFAAEDPARVFRLHPIGDAFVARLEFPASAGQAVVDVLHAATYEPGPVAPGEVVEIRLREAAVEGSRVTFDGAEAVVLGASGGSLLAVVPSAVDGRAKTEVAVAGPGGAVPPVSLDVVPVRPRLFVAGPNGRGPLLAFNDDGGENRPDSPARRGSVVRLYGSGFGALADGGALRAPVKAWMGNLPAEVVFAGAAPDRPAGFCRIDVRAPAGAPPHARLPVRVEAAGQPTQEGVTIAVE